MWMGYCSLNVRARTETRLLMGGITCSMKEKSVPIFWEDGDTILFCSARLYKLSRECSPDQKKRTVFSRTRARNRSHK